MDFISGKDREILRNLARKQVEYANSPKNELVMKKWKALEAGRHETPTVRLLFSNFCDEVIYPRMQCEGAAARDIEFKMLWNMVGRELFDDDTPITNTYDISWDMKFDVFGVKPQITRADSDRGKGFHIDPIIDDLSTQLDQLRGGYFSINRESTNQKVALAEEVFGDILNVRIVMGCLCGFITNPLVQLMGMENYYLAMYDTPDELHELMNMATTLYEQFYDYLEKERFLLPTHGTSPVAQETYAFNHELPVNNVTKTTQCWGFLESQETTAVSPEMYGEFVFPYQDRLVKRFGLLSYGCCERVDAIWPDYLSKWKKLRKLSVSPFNNEPQIGEYLRGSNVVYYSKPRAELLTNPGPLDEDALRKYFKSVCQAARGCLFEIAQREVGTIYGDFERGRRYVEIAKECVEEYWS